MQYTYDAANQTTKIRRYSDSTGTTLVSKTDYAYSLAGSMTSEIDYNSTDTALVSYTNTYDADQRITSEVRNGVTTNYTYNSTSEVTSDGTGNYTYDAAGNRTTTGFTTGVDNRITSDGTWNYTYDSEGNVASKVNISTGETWTYTYSLNNQLLSAADKTSSGTILSQESYT